jgi:hypothetical protein
MRRFEVIDHRNQPTGERKKRSLQKQIPSQQPQTGEPYPIAPASDHPFLNSTPLCCVEFKRERSPRSRRASNTRQSEALRIRRGLGKRRPQWGPGSLVCLNPSGVTRWRRGPGVCPHTPLARVWGAEPRDAKPKPLDHPTPKQSDHPGPRTKTKVHCPLGQQHPTPINSPSKPAAFFSFTPNPPQTQDRSTHRLLFGSINSRLFFKTPWICSKFSKPRIRLLASSICCPYRPPPAGAAA